MLRAVIIMLVSVSLIPIGDSASKILTNQHGIAPVFVAWARYFVGAAVLIVFMTRLRFAVFRLPLAWARGAVLAVGITSITYALRIEDIGTVFGTFFIAPSVSFVLAVIFLGERVTWPRVAFLILGFMGVLLIAKPGFGFSQGLAFALLAGFSFGTFLTLSRAASNQADPLALMFSQVAIACGLTTPFGVPVFPTLTPVVTGLLIISGLASMIGNLGIVVAYRMAPATKLAPLVYFQLCAALAVGWFVFGDWPDFIALIGIGLIIVSGVGSSLLKD